MQIELPCAYIVDDSADYRFLLRHFLKRFLPESQVEFFDGPPALFDHLSQLDSVESGCYLPSVIILDYYMPVIDGFNALKLLKEPSDPKNRTWPRIPVFLNSNGASEHTVNMCLQTGAEGFLNKTAEVEDLKHLRDTLTHYLAVS